MKLGCFTSVDIHGNTYIVAVSLILNDDFESFHWVLQNFKTAFAVCSDSDVSIRAFLHLEFTGQLLAQGPPNTIFTDSDSALAKAISVEFPASSTTHLLCTYHLSLNLNVHTQLYFRGDGSREACTRFKKGLLESVQIIRYIKEGHV